MQTIKTNLNISYVNSPSRIWNRPSNNVETIDFSSNVGTPVVTDITTSTVVNGGTSYQTTTTTATTTTVDSAKEYSAGTAKREYINKILLKDFDKFINEYLEFSNLIKPPFINMGIHTDYTPQGLCKIGTDTFITEYRAGEKSIIKCVNEYGEEQVVQLDGIPLGCHVGGICYDKNSDNFFICSEDGEVAVYSKSSIVNSKNGSAEPLSVYNVGLSSAAYITCHDGKVYVGEWNENKYSDVKEFNVSSKYLVPTGNTFKVPPKTQGLSFYTDKKGNTTIATSCSYGRNNDSHLYLFDYEEGSSAYYKPKKEYTMPPMLEQINFDNNGEITCLFESCSKKYSDGKYAITEVCNIDVTDSL